jgi:hypothetical protein
MGRCFLLTTVALLLTSAPALAEEPPKPGPLKLIPAGLHLSLLLGRGEVDARLPDGSSHDAAGFAYGFRPEVLWQLARPPYEGDAGHGISVGPFAEILRQGVGDTVVGGGMEAYWRGFIGLGVGSYARDPGYGGWQPGLTGTLFLGTHLARRETLVAPVGVRFDGRVGLGDRHERAIVISFEFDPILTLPALFMNAVHE